MADQKIGAGFTYAFLQGFQQNLVFGLGLNLNTMRYDMRQQNNFSKENSRVFDIFVQYSVEDQWEGRNSIDFHLNKGIPGLGASKDRQSGNKIVKTTRSSFWIGKTTLMRQQKLPHCFHMNLIFQGQLADRKIPFSQMMEANHTLFGSAFPDIHFKGDSGYEYQLKLGYEIKSDLVKHSLENLELYAFYAQIYLKNRQNQYIMTKAHRLKAGSSHFGLKGDVIKGLGFFVEGVIPNKKNFGNEKFVKKALFGVSYHVKF